MADAPAIGGGDNFLIHGIALPFHFFHQSVDRRSAKGALGVVLVLGLDAFEVRGPVAVAVGEAEAVVEAGIVEDEHIAAVGCGAQRTTYLLEIEGEGAGGTGEHHELDAGAVEAFGEELDVDENLEVAMIGFERIDEPLALRGRRIAVDGSRCYSSIIK